MKERVSLWRGAGLWLAPLFAMLALFVTPARAHAQASAPLGEPSADPLCPWGRMCHLPTTAPVFPASTYAPSTLPDPAPQGDFTRGAFSSFRDDNYEIYVARGDGRDAVNITNNPAWDLEPQLSPDGAQVLFVSNRDHPMPVGAKPIYNIYVVNVDGANLHRLTTTNDTQSRPAWAPDGSRIVFAMQRNNNVDIYSIKADGSDLKRLTTNAAPDFDPVYRPDGSGIFWVRQYNSTRARLMHASPDGTNAVEFSPPLAYLQRPVVSPTGEFLAHEVDINTDGWLDVAIVALEDLAYDNATPIYTEAPVDFAVAGWSPALVQGAPYPEPALRERSLLISSLLYALAEDDASYELVDVATVGYKGWADGRAVHSSPFDFDFHAVSLDQTPPTTALSAPNLMRWGGPGVAWKATDGGGAGIGFLEWSNFQDTGPGAQPLVSVENIVVSSGRGQAFFTAGIPATIKARTWDFAGNAGPWSAPIVTTLYEYGFACLLTDVRAHPVAGAALSVGAENLIQQQFSAANGVARAWYAGHVEWSALRADADAFGTARFPSWILTASGDQAPDEILLDECASYFRDENRSAVTNGRFEAQPPGTAWRTTCGVTVYQQQHDLGWLIGMGANAYEDICAPGAPIRIAQGIAAAATADMHKPTLTFMYRKAWPLGVADETWPLRVLVTEAGASVSSAVTATIPLTVTPVFTQSHAPETPTLGWVDLSPWAGRAITVTFEVSPVQALSGLQITLDEISLTPWEAPVINAVAYNAADTAAQTVTATATLVITGENFMATPAVSLLRTLEPPAPLTLAEPSTATLLRATLPSGLAAGRYRVRVTNPGGLYSELAFMVNLSVTVFLPLTSK